MAHFHAIAELKQIALAKIFNVTNINTKAGPPNRQTSLTLYAYIARFFNCPNDHHLGDVINFDYVSPPNPSGTF